MSGFDGHAKLLLPDYLAYLKLRDRAVGVTGPVQQALLSVGSGFINPSIQTFELNLSKSDHPTLVFFKLFSFQSRTTGFHFQAMDRLHVFARLPELVRCLFEM